MNMKKKKKMLMIMIEWLMAGSIFEQDRSFIEFKVKEAEKKCFLEDLPKDTLLVVHYEMSGSDVLGTRISVEYNELHRLGEGAPEMLTVTELDRAGKFVFTSSAAGEHRLCIGSNASRWHNGGTELGFKYLASIGAQGTD